MMISLAVIYLIMGALLLGFVNYRWSLIGWLTAEFVHLSSIQQSFNSCTMTRWLTSMSELCFWLEDLGFLYFTIIIIGVLLVFNFQPSGFSLANKRVEKGIANISGLLSMAWVLVMAGGVIWSVQKPAFGWVLLEVEDTPGPLQDGEAVYDAQRNRVVLFGGASGYIGDNQWEYKNDTWEWDGQAWTRMPTAVYPPARLDHAVAYDEERGVVVLFGGRGQNGRMSDTWEWDGTNWAQSSPVTSPPGRSAHALAFDNVRGRTVLFGGERSSSALGDTWEFDGKIDQPKFSFASHYGQTIHFGEPFINILG